MVFETKLDMVPRLNQPELQYHLRLTVVMHELDQA